MALLVNRDIHYSQKYFTKSVHLNGGKDLTWNSHIGRETLQVYLHQPQAVCVIGGCDYLTQHLLIRWIGRKIAEDWALISLANKMAWPNAKRYVKDCLFTACITGPAWDAKTNHRYHLRNRPWRAAGGMEGNGLSACRLLCHKERTHRALRKYAKNLENFYFHL